MAVKYGIPLDLFMKLNPRLMERYQPYFQEQLKQRREDISDAGWTNGLYVGRAIGSCFSKNTKYPDEPLKLWGTGEEVAVTSEPFTDADRFAGFAAAFNRNRFG